MNIRSQMPRYLQRLACALPLAFAVWLAGPEGPVKASEHDCADMREVPFAGGAAGSETWQLLHAENDFCLQIDARLIPLGDLIALSVERVGGRLVVFGRRRISNYLAALVIPDTGSPEPVEMSFDQLSKLHLEGTFVLGDSIYLLAYDVAYNLPSGRRRVVPKEYHGLFRVDFASNGNRLATIDEAYLKAGLEAGTRIWSDGRIVWLCFGNECQKLSIGEKDGVAANPPLTISINGAAANILELAVGPAAQAFALVILNIDDRAAPIPGAAEPVYHICRLSSTVACDPIGAEDVPYRLRLEAGQPRWNVAKSKADIADLMLFDLSRTGLNGVANFGENNLEGRLAWSQAYYLNGLLSILELSDQLGLSEDFKGDVRNRYLAEIDELADLALQPYPGFMVKRYSLDREPLISLLHIGRVLKPVWRGSYLLSSQTLAKFGVIGAQFAQGEGAIEKFDPPTEGASARAHMRKYVPLGSDGADLPWNVRSSWIEGLSWSPRKPAEMTEIARNLCEHFIKKALGNLPEKWPYASGNSLSGWSADENVSANTPSYGGDKANPNGAHISYRSMDALAVLAASRTGIISENTGVSRHLRALVGRGLLYPFVNEEFAARGNPAFIPVSAGRLYARAILPWQVQNLPWSLLSLEQK
jgi:hypothetical protein